MTDEPVPVPLLRPASAAGRQLPALDESSRAGRAAVFCLVRPPASATTATRPACSPTPSPTCCLSRARPRWRRSAPPWRRPSRRACRVWVALSALIAVATPRPGSTTRSAGLAVACSCCRPGELRIHRTASDAGRPRWGGLLDESSSAEAWLDAGAVGARAARRRLAGSPGARPRRHRPSERAVLESLRQAEDAWWAHVRRAASMAEGGAALWLGRAHRGDSAARAHSRTASPGSSAARQESGAIPIDHFRLIVDAHVARRTLEFGPSVCWPWLERGGLLASRDMRPSDAPAGLRTIVSDDSDPPLVILRRET